METKGIIFDCYGVLCERIGPRWFERYLPREEGIEDKYCIPLDWGRMSDEEFFGALASLTGTSASLVQDQWLSLIKPKKDVHELVRALKGKYQLAICSNAGSWFFRETMERLGISSEFDEIVVSSEVKLAKPDAGIFTYTLSKMGTAPGETVFIDDAARNTATAEALGMRSVLYTDTQALQQELASIGIG